MIYYFAIYIILLSDFRMVGLKRQCERTEKGLLRAIGVQETFENVADSRFKSLYLQNLTDDSIHPKDN